MDELNVRVKRVKDTLEKLSCGVIGGVAIDNGGEVAITDDSRSVFGYVKDDALDFKADIGIYNLNLFLAFLTTVSNYEKISSMDIRDNRLVLTADGDEYQYLLAESKLISQKIKEPKDTIGRMTKNDKVAEVDLVAKLPQIMGALTLLTTDTAWIKISGGKLFLEVGTSIEHRVRITLADVVGEGEWKVSLVLLQKILSTAQGSESIMLELRTGIPLAFRFSNVFIGLALTTDKEKKETK
jgi:hypothetical protein